MSITTLNGLRAAEDGIRNGGGLENIVVGKDIKSVKSPHKAYLAYLDAERKKEDSQKRKRGQAFEKQEESELKKKREEDLKRIESLRKATKNYLQENLKQKKCLKIPVHFLRVMREWQRD